jgi:hypothetical protein
VFASGATLAAALAAVAAPGHAVAPPSALAAKTQAEVAIIGAVLGTCLTSRERGVMIADLPAADRGDLRPAAPEDRKIVPDKAAPAWTSDKMGGHVVIYEPSSDRCDVVADQLPVEAPGETCVVAMLLAQHLPTRLNPLPTNLAQDPVVCQLEGVAGGQRYVVHIEGAPLSGGDHAAQVGSLRAWVAREPSDAKPLSR